MLTYRAFHSSGMNGVGVNRFGEAAGVASEKKIVSRKIDLMSEINVYGVSIWSSSGFDVGLDNQQFSLFRLKPELKNATLNGTYYNYWLKDIANKFGFVFSGGWGESEYANASAELAIRPSFLLG